MIFCKKCNDIYQFRISIVDIYNIVYNQRIKYAHVRRGATRRYLIMSRKGR